MIALKPTIDVQSLNMLFNELAAYQHNVFWIRSLDFQKQLYVSPNYEAIWGRGCDILYKNPNDWEEAIIVDKRVDTVRQFSDWLNPIQQNAGDSVEYQKLVACFKIKTPTDKIVEIKDWCFPVYVKEKPAAIAGIAECYPWTGQDRDFTNHFLDGSQCTIDVINILKQDFDIHLMPEDTELDVEKIQLYILKELGIELASREIQCIHYLCKGLSAKQTAKKVNLSHRTVEYYLGNARKKLQCSNQAVVISLLSRFFE